MTAPNLFVVGAMKAGTTTLYAWLASHPQIYMSPVKEPNYFCDDLWPITHHIARGTPALVRQARVRPVHNALIEDEALYASLYPGEGDGYLYFGEASPAYLRSQTAAGRIRNRSPDARIIAVLRDPIDRIWSHYLMERNEARAPDDFLRLVEDEQQTFASGRRTQHGFLESGLYCRGLRRYFDAFGRSRVLVMDQAKLRDRNAALAEIATFLGLDVSRFGVDGEAANSTVAPRFPSLNRAIAASGVKQAIRRATPQSVIDWLKPLYYGRAPAVSAMPDAARAQLRRLYADDMANLAALLGDGAPPWTRAYRDQR